MKKIHFFYKGKLLLKINSILNKYMKTFARK